MFFDEELDFSRLKKYVEHVSTSVVCLKRDLTRAPWAFILRRPFRRFFLFFLELPWLQE